MKQFKIFLLLLLVVLLAGFCWQFNKFSGEAGAQLQQQIDATRTAVWEGN